MNLKGAVTKLEDAIITISGPALAISGIIAGVDLVTGGNILRSIWWLSLVWAITLLLTLDFQVLALGVRAHRVYASNKQGWQKAAEIALAFIIAGAISYVSIQMQSIIARVNAEGIGIDAAALQLGINTIWLIWERSSLVLVLIFISGWLREHDDDATVEASIPAPATPDLTSILEQIEARQQQRIEAVMREVKVTIETVVGNSTEIPAVKMIEPAKGVRPEQSIADVEDVETPVEPSVGEQSYSDRIAALVSVKQDITVREVANIVGCSVSTAAKWMKRLEVSA